MTVLIDNGHGADTPGKRSPDGALREYELARDLARRTAAKLTRLSIACRLLVPEDSDVPLRERVRRANACGRDAVLISIHSNASGDGSAWQAASGWSDYVAPAASAKSRMLARLLTDEARALNLLGNRALPECGYLTSSLAICRDTVCPAVLTENLFHDNRFDAAFLLSSDGRDVLAELHAAAVVRYLQQL